MRKAMLGLGLTLSLLLLTSCKAKVGGDDQGEGNHGASLGIGDTNVAAATRDGADGISISAPGFEGKVSIPGMAVGGDNMDIDGIKLYPDSTLHGINVIDREGPDNGMVDLRFTSPVPPEKVASYYAAAAREQNFTDIKLAKGDGKAVLTATKTDGDALTIEMTRAPGGTAGRILIKDGKGG